MSDDLFGYAAEIADAAANVKAVWRCLCGLALGRNLHAACKGCGR